jgi:GTP-binding protein EngB required for normal cell division
MEKDGAYHMLSARFDGGQVEQTMRGVHSRLQRRGQKVHMVHVQPSQNFGCETVLGLNLVKKNSGLFIIVGTSKYGEVTGSAYGSWAELRFAVDHGLRILPLQFDDTWPPQPPYGPDHQYDKEGMAQAYIAFAIRPSTMYVDCRGKSEEFISNQIELALQAGHGTRLKGSQAREAGAQAQPRSAKIIELMHTITTRQKLEATALSKGGYSKPVPPPTQGKKVMRFMFVGNPGRGKSTLANCIAKKIIFRAGASQDGYGVTDVLDIYIDEGGIVWVDTPGLADEKLRRAAAAAISRALKDGGETKIFFVISEHTGRFSPEDLTTMKLVLDACPEIGSDFGVIVNHCGKKFAQNFISQRQERSEALFAKIPDRISPYIHAIAKIPELDEEENTIVDLPQDFLDFFEEVPSVALTPEKADNVNDEGFDEVRDKMSELVQMREQDRKKLQNEIAARELAAQQLKEEKKRRQEERVRMQRELEQKRKPRTCPKCDGTGQIYVSSTADAVGQTFAGIFTLGIYTGVRGAMTAGQGHGTHPETCPRCDGDGTI